MPDRSPVAEPFQLPFYILRAADERLQHLLNENSIGGHAIGIVGPRGSGKSFLIQEACARRAMSSSGSVSAVYVSVEQSGSSVEIARNIVAILCAVILGEIGGFRNVSSADSGRRLSGVASVMIAAGGAAFLVSSIVKTHINAQVGAGVGLLLAAIVLWTLGGRGFPRRLRWKGGYLRLSGWRRRETYKLAAALLETLTTESQFEVTETSGWTAGLKPTVGPNLNASHSVSRKAIPMSLTRLASEYRRLVDTLERKNLLVIGIDGLDELDPRTDMSEILMDLRPFLTTFGCCYLIALADSQAREVSDLWHVGNFIHCEPLTLKEAKEILLRRGELLPDEISTLCYAMSDGHPRTLLKAAGLWFNMSESHSVQGTSNACIALVESELGSLADQLRRAAGKTLEWKFQQALYDWAEQLEESPPTAESTLSVAANIYVSMIGGTLQSIDDVGNLSEFLGNIAALSYLDATLLGLFRDNPDFKFLESVPPHGRKEMSLTELVYARRLINSKIYGPAWKHISSFRAAWQMPSIRA